MLFSIAVLALLASVQGRAVNISNTWVLPEEGFPVFYRYFRDRISWYEADAVCQFHHANLVTVDTTAQYDAVRAYLKELDISSAVWVGLIRSNPDGDFTWTDYRGLSGDGYWSSAPDARSAPLCAAADPAADYRWEARACGGPTVASFICELPVPQWALGTEGCMVRALPALTILYLPESAAVQLTADCGMAGVKKVQCTGNVKREDLLKELSCADEDDLSSTPNLISTGFNWPASTDSTSINQDTTNEITTEETITTESEIETNQTHDITVTSLPHYIYPKAQYKLPTIANKFINYNHKIETFGENQDNNVQSNFIPKVANEDNILTNDELEKLEDERHMQHKMLHEEIARVGNVENIFTQPTDHFIPPLVMAKAKISDDMTVLSLAEKHAQQLAEKQFSKHNLNIVVSDHSFSDNYEMPHKFSTAGIDKPSIASMKPTKFNDSKKEVLKAILPKKYVNEKHYDVKSKMFKSSESKEIKPTEELTTTESSVKNFETTTKKTNLANKGDVADDLGMDLTVILNDAPLTSEEHTSFSGDVVKLETIRNSTNTNNTEPLIGNLDNILNEHVEFILSTPEINVVENITINHEVIKITNNADDTTTYNTTVFEITTKMPVFRDNIVSNNFTMTPFTTMHPQEIQTTENVGTTNKNETYEATTKIVVSESSTVPVTYFTTTISTSLVTENVNATENAFTSTETTTTTDIITTTEIQPSPNQTKEVHEVNTVNTTSLPITTVDVDNNTDTSHSNESIVKTDEMNSAEYHELINVTDHRHGEEEDVPDPDFQSPLLSGVMEPMHRPPRTRRPQQPNRNKFNPFRILG